jgi:drug/metabolite transporter (DMT)-like permease
MWLFITLLGNAMLAVVAIIDKFILTKSVSKPVIFVFYSTIFVLSTFLLLPFGVRLPTIWTDYIIFSVSGVCFSFALWTLYIAIQKSEISRIGPLIGAVIPIFILFFSRIFLGERLGPYGLVAVVVLIVGSIVISFGQSASSAGQAGWRSAMSWGILTGLLFAISHVIAKYAYDAYGFYSGFVLTKAPIGIFGVALLFSPSVRALFGKKSKIPADKTSNKKQLYLIVGDITLGVIAATLLQYATALGSVTLVNSLAGAQYAMLIVFVAVISKFFPKILKETFTKKEIIKKTVAVFIISIGLVLLLVK